MSLPCQASGSRQRHPPLPPLPARRRRAPLPAPGSLEIPARSVPDAYRPSSARRPRPKRQRFRIGDGFASAPALAPRHPMLSSLRRLHQSPLAQFHLSAADHQLLYEKRIAEAEDRADIVVLCYAVQHHRNRPARAREEFVAGVFGAAQLRRRHYPTHIRVRRRQQPEGNRSLSWGLAAQPNGAIRCPPSALMRQIGWVEEGRISGSS